MAKKRKSNKNSRSAKVRSRAISTTPRSARRSLRSKKYIVPTDRRTYTPLRAVPMAMRIDGKHAAIDRRSVNTRTRTGTQKPVRVFAFRDAQKVAICVRRKERREVIHAKGISGGKVRRGRRNEFSSVRC
jgi:hypothetical protein